MEPVEISFARDVRLARWTCFGAIVVGAVVLWGIVVRDPPPESDGGTTGPWIVVVLLCGFGALGLWAFRHAGHSALRIDATGITSTTGRGSVLITWSELAAVDVWVKIRRAPAAAVIGPRGLRTKIHILVRLAPTHTEFGSRPDLRPLRRIIGGEPFTRAIGVLAPPFSSGDSLPEVDQIAAALAAFGGTRSQGVVRA